MSWKKESLQTNACHSHHFRSPPAVEAWVGKGQHLKRISMHGRGRSGRRLRYRSHLTVRPYRWGS